MFRDSYTLQIQPHHSKNEHIPVNMFQEYRFISAVDV